MPWTVDEIKSLIGEMEDKPVLWNVFSDEYQGRVKKSEVLNHSCSMFCCKFPVVTNVSTCWASVKKRNAFCI